MKKNFKLLCLITMLLVKSLVAFAQAVDVNDSLALVDLYNSTNGPDWNVNYGWLKGPVKTWAGVTLTQNGTRVKELYMYNSNLSGTIPNSIGDLTKCDYLNFDGNKLTGIIPYSLGNLTSVQRLFLGGNNLIGVIPANLGSLSNLSWLDVSSNKLTGEIPPSIGTSPLLTKLNVRHNKFTFEGLEGIVQRNIQELSYFPQDTILPIKISSGKLFVSAGGTLKNNKYIWSNNAGPGAVIEGDSTFAHPNAGNYRVDVENSTVPGFWLTGNTIYASPILIIDPNPSMITANGKLSADMLKIDFNKKVTKAATDGITKVLLVTTSYAPVTFSLGSFSGKLSTLTDQSTQGTQVTVTPGNDGKAVAVYTVPEGYGKGNLVAKQVEVVATTNTEVIGTASFELVKPPVVLVHGMWSNPDVWHSGGFVSALKKAGFINVFPASYEADNASTFNPASPASLPGRTAVAGAVQEALWFNRLTGTAVTQVDIVGHSLGGLMSRSWSQQPGFKNVRNYQKGYIHKLITLGTPHRGSPMGPELFASQNNFIRISRYTSIPIQLKVLLALLEMPVGSCHPDFGVTSPGIMALESTPSYHTYSIVGNQIGQLPGYLAFYAFSLAALNKNYVEIFKAQDPCAKTLSHDLVVPLSSQQGYISSSSTYFATGHSIPAFTTETNSPFVQSKVIDLLLSDDMTEFSSGFPKPSEFPLDCTTANQKSSTQSKRSVLKEVSSIPYTNQGVRITSPASGTSFVKDTNTVVTLTYEKVGNAKPYNCVFMVGGENWFTITDSSANSTSFKLPGDVSVGKLNIVLLARDSSGFRLGDTMQINILPNGVLDSLAVDPGEVKLDSSTRQSSLSVRGYFRKQEELLENDLTHASTGTLYTANSDTVFAVSGDGLVTAKKIGSDTLTISNRTKTIKMLVTVDSSFALATYYSHNIDFEPLPDKYVDDEAFALEATATSGQDVVFTILSGPASLSNGVVVLDSTAGIVTVRASLPKSAYFDSAVSVTRSFNVLAVSTYSFVGNGNWSNPSNWLNAKVPPATLPAEARISVNPIVGGECILNVPQVISEGAKLSIEPGKKFTILSTLRFQ